MTRCVQDLAIIETLAQFNVIVADAWRRTYEKFGDRDAVPRIVAIEDQGDGTSTIEAELRRTRFVVRVRQSVIVEMERQRARVH